MTPEPKGQTAFLDRAVELTIRLGLVMLLIGWCFYTVRPFILPAIWGIIIAVAAYPGYLRLRGLFGGRRRLTASVVALLGLLVIILPVVLLGDTLASGGLALAEVLESGPVSLPPPPESIREWSFIGGPLYATWEQASSNLDVLLERFTPQLKALGGVLVAGAANFGLAMLQFIVAIIIAPILMMHADSGGQTADTIARRLAGPRGPEFADLAEETIRNVTRGILGVAVIQALLAGLGLLVAGVPAAGLLALVCLILATIQIGVAPVMIPAAIYVFYASGTGVGLLFAVWAVLVTLSDSVLKPVLLGRGARVPMLVIFLGAIGGFITSGIIGLFTGAVILTLGYTLFIAWLNQPAASDPDAPEDLQDHSRVDAVR